MTTKEAEGSFNIPEKAIRKLCKEGKIKGAKKINGKYEIPNDMVMIITDEAARAFLYQLLKYKNNPELILSSAGSDDEQKIELWREYLINQGLVSKCGKKKQLKDLLDAIQITDKGLEFLFGKNSYKILVNLNPTVNVNIGLINV